MVAFAETSRPTHRAYAPKCVGSSSCAPGKNPSLGVDRNQQYSVTALTNASGTITERYSYSAYGQPVFFDGSGTAISASAESNRYTYTGREWDDGLSLYHYRARMYDSSSGRFLGRDPIGFVDGESLYALQISLHMLDPKGTQKLLPPVLPPVLQPKPDPFVIPKEPRFLKICPTPPECRWSYTGNFEIVRDREFVWDWFVEEISGVGWPAWVKEDPSTVPVGRSCKVEVDATMTCREECRLPNKPFFPNGKTKTVGATFTAEGIVEIVPGFGKQCSANIEIGESMTNYECK